MGAIFNSKFMKSKTIKELRREFEELQDEARIMEGESYSGSWNMATGLETTDMEFKNEFEADNWLEENTEKWEAVKAVKVKGKWYIGGWFAS